MAQRMKGGVDISKPRVLAVIIPQTCFCGVFAAEIPWEQRDPKDRAGIESKGHAQRVIGSGLVFVISDNAGQISWPMVRKQAHKRAEALHLSPVMGFEDLDIDAAQRIRAQKGDAGRSISTHDPQPIPAPTADDWLASPES